MTLKELRSQLNNEAYDEYADLQVTNGYGVPIDFIDAIDIPDPKAPASTEEQLADPMHLSPHIKVFMIDGYTKEEMEMQDCNQTNSFEFWFIELQKIFMLVDGTEAEPDEKENYRADYSLGLSPAEVVEKYSEGALNRKSQN